MSKTHTHTLKFLVEETSKGYLAHGVEIPAIIIEAPTQQKLKGILDTAVDCYLNSFPQEHDVIFNKKVETIEIPVTI